jgi:predicted O-methyltransferase YrrM
VEEKIVLHIGPAYETLERFIAGGQENTFDMAFIDADKQSIPGYLERCLKLVRPNGLILVDNVLRGGKILDEHPDIETKVLQEFNASLLKRQDVEAILLPIFDGLTMIRKK